MVSGGVAALKSLKPSATLADTESALTSASGMSSKAVTINGISRPTLRLTSSGYKLIGLTEPNPISLSPNPIPKPVIATQGKVCFYPKVNYQGNPNCVVFSYGNWGKSHKISAKVGSVKVEPVNGNAPITSTKVTYFHYAPIFSLGFGVYLNLTPYMIHLHFSRGTLGTREGYLIFTGFVSSRPNEQLTSQYCYRHNMGRIVMMPPCSRHLICPSGAVKAAHQHLNASFIAMTPYLQIPLID